MTENPAQSPAPAELARALVEVIAENNGEDIHLLDLRGLSDIADWFVIANAKSRKHLRTLGQELIDKVREANIGPFRAEGLNSESWIIIDLYDVVVHLFIPERREYYALDDYWADAPREIIDEELATTDTDDE